MSVILTNQVLDSPAASAYSAVTQGQVPPDQVPPGCSRQGQSALADAFGNTYVVARRADRALHRAGAVPAA